MDQQENFYCPVYEGDINDYDCDEISTGIHLGYFISDGLPFLMDIKTATRRKLRCHNCPRCPEQYRPQGIETARALRHLGFPDDAREAEEVLELAGTRADVPCTLWLEGRLCCLQLKSGIQLWQEMDLQNSQPHDTLPHFYTANAMYLQSGQPARFNKAGKLARSRFFAGARRRQGGEALLSNSFSSPNLSIFKERFVQDGEYVAQVCAFPKRLVCFNNEEDYLKRREGRLAAESFVSGDALPGGEGENPGCEALLTGVVRAAARHSNELTGLPFYHLELSCLGLTFDVVAAPDLFLEEPCPGNVLQGVFSLSARVLDYHTPEFNLEMDVDTPLSAARFAPLAHGLRALQPGERLYCGLVTPLADIVFVRAKGEVEGLSVEFRLQKEKGNEAPFRILRFYPVSRDMAVTIFEQTLVHHNPPDLGDAKDVTAEYTRKTDEEGARL